MAWNLLLTSDFGLLSLFTILFVIAMAVYLFRFAQSHMAADAAARGKAAPAGPKGPH